MPATSSAAPAEAGAKGETVKKRPPLGVIYFAVGIAFVIVGIFTLIGALSERSCDGDGWQYTECWLQGPSRVRSPHSSILP